MTKMEKSNFYNLLYESLNDNDIVVDKVKIPLLFGFLNESFIDRNSIGLTKTLEHYNIEDESDKEDNEDSISTSSSESDEDEELVSKSIDLIRSTNKASTSFLQRNFQIGYNKPARIMEALEQRGVVSPPNHAGKREILLSN